MNRPDKAGEPSMEEILASIRQIIADDPPSDRGGLAVEPNPLVPQSASPPNPNESQRSDGRTPLVDRLSDVLKSGPLPPTSPLGSKRPLSFDQDLADMFEEGDGKAGTPVPKPDLRVPFEPSSALRASTGQSPVEERSATMASSFVSSSSASSTPTPSFGASSMAPAAPSEPPMPFGSASAPQPAAPAPPKTFGFPPLRKQSFYPPQPKATPELPPISPKGPAVASETETSGAGKGDDDGGLESAIARLTGLGAVVPGQSGSPAQVGLNGASLNGASVVKDAGLVKEPGSLNGSFNGSGSLNGSGSFNGSSAFGSLGSASRFSAAPSEPTLPDLSVTPDFAPLEAERVVETTEFEPVVTFDHAPFGARSSVPASDVSPTVGAEHATVAAQALDALAQGLAASAAAAAQPAIPLTPVVEPAPEALRASSAPHVQTLPVATLAPAQAAPSRTLEDAVAEMLRPMLQQWVADNMPRIIEKALRVEVARNVKPDLSSKS